MINAERIPRDVIVIGASAGGVQPIIDILSALPPGFPAAIGIVLHRNPFHESQLRMVLARHAAIPVVEPCDGDPLRGGVAYVAPRDQHLIMSDGVVRLTRGAKEHRTRPAIDPLFRSAAASYGRRVVGVILSGMGADGVFGLIAIERAGGLSLVQSPDEARFPSMPYSALTRDDVDAELSVDRMAAVLAALAAGEAVETELPVEVDLGRRGVTP